MSNFYLRYASPISNQKMIQSGTDVLNLIATNNTKEHYLSLYQYTEDQYNKYKQTSSASGMTGMKTNMLVFDFDSKIDVELARTDAKEMFTRLLHSGLTEDSIQMYYSGSKGFHVVITLNQFLEKKQILNIVRNLGTGLDTLDLQIYDEQRLFRCPLSFHAKSGLYKIPLSKDALFNLSLNDIRTLAKEQDIHVDQLNAWNYEVILPQQLLEFKEIEEEQFEDFNNSVISADSPDFSRKPKHITDAKFALQEGYFEEGERNHAYMILAALYRHLGYSKEIAYNMLKATDRLHVKRCKLNGKKRDIKPKEEIWNQIITTTYSDNWTGGTYSESDDWLLKKTKTRYQIKENTENNTIDIGKVGNFTLDFAQNVEANRIKLGIQTIDNDIMITTGMLVALLGAASSSKTTLALNIMRNLSENGQTVLFNSLDMYTPFILSRLLQRHSPMPFEAIIKEIKETGYNGKLKESWDKVQEEFKNVKFNFKSGPTVEDLENQIKTIQKETGSGPKLMVIDYLEKIVGPFSDATANSAFIAGKLADMARDYNTCILLLVQPQKSAGTPADALLSYRNIKGSSRLEQDCRVVLTIWRPGFNPENNDLDKYASIAVVKNNMGSVFKRDFKFDGAKGTYTPIEYGFADQFKDDMQEINKRKMIQAQAKEKGYVSYDDI